jgi:hypothetical protein
MPGSRRFLLNRRAFLGTTAAAAGAAFFAPRAEAMSGLLRIVDLGVGATIHPGSANDLRVGDNRAILEETGTHAIRLWADWPSLQPNPALAPDDPASPGAPYLAALDAQIAAADEDGLRVVLLLYRFPLWANGMEALGAVRGTDAEISFMYADRIAPAAWQRYVAGGRDPAVYTPSRRGLEFAVPAEGCGPGTAWARMFAFLHERYRPDRAGLRVDGIELVNEPNFQLWPQRTPSPTADEFALGDVLAQRTIAQMMAAAREVSAAAGHPMLIFTPSFADSDQRGRTVTPHDVLTVALLDELEATGAAVGPNEVWAHHNYTDMEGRVLATKTQAMRALMRGRWTGLADPTGPVVVITEGGVRISRMRALYPAEDPRAAQATSMALALSRHAANSGPGAGVWMLAQYTIHADPGFDSGLMEVWPSTVRRPVFAAWSAGPRGPVPTLPLRRALPS